MTNFVDATTKQLADLVLVDEEMVPITLTVDHTDFTGPITNDMRECVAMSVADLGGGAMVHCNFERHRTNTIFTVTFI